MPVGLHEVKLRAQMASRLIHLVGVAVVEGISPVVHDGHANGRDGGHTAAADIAQVHVVLDGASKEVGSVVLGCVEGCRLRQVQPLGVLELGAVAGRRGEVYPVSSDSDVIRGGPLRVLNVEGLFGSILCDRQGRVSACGVCVVGSDVGGSHLEVGELLGCLALAASLALTFLHEICGVTITA